MKGCVSTHYLWLAGLLILLTGCFPGKTLRTAQPNVLALTHGTGEYFKTPAKLHLKDSTMVLFRDGFTIRDDQIEGMGQRYRIGDVSNHQHHVIAFDSIATIAYFEEDLTAGMALGSFIMGLTGALMLPHSIYCLSCPKCCFGSCPTVYTHDHDDYSLEAELFSYSLSRYYQETDIDRLGQLLDPDGYYKLRLTNEALETHYINQFNLITVQHPEGTQAYPTPGGDVVLVDGLEPPLAAIGSKGENILPLIIHMDDLWHVGDTTRLKDYRSAADNEWLDLTLNVPEDSKEVILIMRIRNTLLSTVLFYDVVLASQGIRALEWTQRLQTDSLYATFYHAIYNQFAGITVKVKDGDLWKAAERIGDVGPIAWKEVGVVLPVPHNTDGTLQVRLEWFPDNFMIDFIGYDNNPPATAGSVVTESIQPASIKDYQGNNLFEVWEKIRDDDTSYLITYPGDHYYFEYKLSGQQAMSTTILLISKGYYTEWLRGDWITNEKGDYQFNLFALDETIEQLKQSWYENRHLLESTFFKTRIPLKEAR